MRLTVIPVEGIGEVREGDDLAALLAGAASLQDGDVVVVTSKVVSKAEGRVVERDREAAIDGETERDVARHGALRIVRNRLGLTMAAAGVDASNTRAGTVVLLPLDPDASARAIRERVDRRYGRNVAVLVTDTAGRAWREGQTDIAVGAAGIDVLDDHAGRMDPYGNLLAVTSPAIADELAGAGDLVKGKLGRTPAAIVRGLAERVLPRGEHGPGAESLVRDERQDLFGYGTRDAVVNAVTGGDIRGFGAPASQQEMARVLGLLGPGIGVLETRAGLEVSLGDDPWVAGRLAGAVAALVRAHVWEVAEESTRSVSVRPRTP